MPIVSSLILLLTATPSLAGTPSHLPCEPFGSGERTVFALTYFGATAGTAELSAESAGKEWLLGALAKTDLVFSLFYRVEDRYEATVNARTFLASSMKATIDESRQSGTTLQEFDRNKQRFRFLDNRQEKNRGEIKRDESSEMPSGTLDVISALFAIRRTPLAMGTDVKIPVLIGREVSLLSLKVEDQELLPTKIGKVDSWILNASITKGGVTKQVPESKLWIAKEGARQLLKIKAKVKIGSVIAYLRSYTPSNSPGCALGRSSSVRNSEPFKKL